MSIPRLTHRLIKLFDVIKEKKMLVYLACVELPSIIDGKLAALI